MEGKTDVDVKTGHFSYVSTYSFKDGIITGEHKVFVQCIVNGGLSRKLIPDEYASVEKTPLRVKSSDKILVLKIPKPR